MTQLTYRQMAEPSFVEGYGTEVSFEVCDTLDGELGGIAGFTLNEQDARLFSAAPELLATLKALTDWGRDHTSPRDENSPHALLVAAVAAIHAAEG